MSTIRDDVTAPVADAPAASLQRPSLGEALAGLLRRARGGDVGPLPVIVGLAIIWAVMQALNSAFLSPRNLVNLLTQCASVGTIAIGVVLVLLVAQIDLSIGSMSGLAAAILGVGLTQLGWSLPFTIIVALAAGLVLGLVYSAALAWFGVPTFVATLAGLLALLGLQLQILGTHGSINIPFDTWLVRFMQQMYVPRPASYALAAAVAVLYLLSRLARARRRRLHGLPSGSQTSAIVRCVALLVILEVACWYLNQDHGISAPFVLFVVLVIIIDILLSRTRWGRQVYAVGGSIEAARRAGINVHRVIASALVLGTLFATVGGLLAAGRISAASTSSGTGTVNLNAIAAAVIGGTSLFGGRGNAYSALLGILVIQSIANGLTLLNLAASVQFMITGGVLMVAVIVDSLTRRRRAAHGRA
jgi:ABC-type xylose transport system permease subunit